MSKFIRLTESMTGGDTRTLLLPVNKIVHIQRGLNGKDTHIRMNHINAEGRDAYYFVKDTIEEIAKKLELM